MGDKCGRECDRRNGQVGERGGQEGSGNGGVGRERVKREEGRCATMFNFLQQKEKCTPGVEVPMVP